MKCDKLEEILLFIFYTIVILSYAAIFITIIILSAKGC